MPHVQRFIRHSSIPMRVVDTTRRAAFGRMRPVKALAIAATVASVASGLISLGAGSTALGGSAKAVDFEHDIQPIFDEHCAVCHQTGSENAGLNLESGNSRSSLINVRSTESALARVAPGDPAHSYLLHKIKGTQIQAGGSGVQMPLGGPPLSPEEIQLIENWIESKPSK
jgi:mono/diheme cytochrome c family protein